MQASLPEAIFQKIGYRFKDEKLLELALTHCSYNGAKGQNNQRLEFLGDAVLGFVVSEQLYKEVNADEGHLSRMRANIVREASLAQAAKALGLEAYIRLGKGEETSGGRDKPSILADLLEAVLGAVYLDGGLKNAERLAFRAMKPAINRALDDGGEQDHKTMLQQLCAALQLEAPAYVTSGVEGPPHDPKFTVEVSVGNKALASGIARSKKEAEQKAAKLAIETLQRHGTT